MINFSSACSMVLTKMCGSPSRPPTLSLCSTYEACRFVTPDWCTMTNFGKDIYVHVRTTFELPFLAKDV